MLLACSLVALALAGSPAGVRDLETTLQDDSVLLHSSPPAVAEAARRIAWLGADRVRLTAGWSALAPVPAARRRPGAPFDPGDSRTYPREGWLRLDRAVKAAVAAGLDTQIDLAFWAPRWAVRRTPREPGRARFAPDAREFAAFAGAVAQRYDGSFPDPEREGARLPAVRLYTTWNEPNNPTFLQPQWTRGGRPASPHLYRAMHEAAYDSVKRVSPDNRVLVGGTANTGSRRPGRGGVPPLAFVRALACVDERLAPLAVPECAGYRPLRADGFAHHPYSRHTTPATSDPDPDDAPLADTGRLTALLDALARRGRLARRLDVFHTEYGYESNPPDPTAPFSPADQARFVGWSTYLAWRDPDVRMFAQFLLEDIDPRESGLPPGHRRYWSDFQTGLFTADGEPKPAAQAFRTPFWAQAREVAGQRLVLLFGGVRPGPGRQVVRVERREAPEGPWLATAVSGETCDGETGFLTDAAGWFVRVAPDVGPATYRLAWLRGDGQWEHGPEVAVSPPAALSAGARPSPVRPRRG